MAAGRRSSDCDSSVAGNASNVPGPASTTSAQRDSTAPRQDPNIPRAYQRLPEQDRFKRRTDIENPYVRIRRPAPTEPRALTMAGGHRSSPTSKSQANSVRQEGGYKEPSKRRSLLDTDVGIEGWADAEGSSRAEDIKPEAEVKKEDTQENALERLLDLGVKTGPVAIRKSLMEQLYELQGLHMENGTTNTATSANMGNTEMEALSTTTSSESLEGTEQQRNQVERQLAIFGNLFIEETPLWDEDPSENQPNSSSNSNAVPPTTAEASKTDGSTPSGTTETNSTPSITSTELPLPSTIPHTGVTTFQSQELSKETEDPLNVLGTEILYWDPDIATSEPIPLEVDAKKQREKNTDNGGYVRRFTRKSKESEDQPTEENAMVKYDPFGGLWGYAANKFSTSEKRLDPKAVSPAITEKKEEEKEKKKKETTSSFDDLESFLNPGMEDRQSLL
ncbi:MAG: hypothetical protein Q9213_002791 [Squamulea squamosa]